ncbi:MAG: septal ring lytic transglycosylase RlpA family protein [Porticoccus sp.]
MRVSSIRIVLNGLLLVSALLLHGCGGSGTTSTSGGGGYGYGDGPPSKDIDVSSLPDAVPKIELITRAGNTSPYTVLGKTYELLPTSRGYQERGVASWYGNKFHGRKTSNGEIYSMYGMTAAHKTLPIPSYVRVTNLANNRSVIVRVNDRGPFHGARIIDLSYAAAKKLDYSAKGTATVEVVAIDPRDYQKNTVEQPRINETPVVTTGKQPAAGKPGNQYLQVGAFSSQVAADDLLERLQGVSEYPVVVRQLQEPQPLYKVLVGPVNDQLKLFDLRDLLKQSENLSPFVVYE